MQERLVTFQYVNKWCFINKVREEHVQIIHLINTRGAQSVINPVNKVRGVYIYIYIYTADSLLFLDSSPPSLRHLFSALTTISVLTLLWVRAKALSSEPSPRTARQIHIISILFIICKCELVKCKKEDQWQLSLAILRWCHHYLFDRWKLWWFFKL